MTLECESAQSLDHNKETKNDPALPVPPPPPFIPSRPTLLPTPHLSPPPVPASSALPAASASPLRALPPSSPYPNIIGVITEMCDNDEFKMKAVIGSQLYEGKMGKSINQPLKNILNPPPATHTEDKYPFITAIANGKFTNGYFVRAMFQSQNYVGHLHLGHVPGQERAHQTEPAPSQGSVPKRKKMKKKDTNRPIRTRSGYNYFFAEQHVRLRPLHPKLESTEVSRLIGDTWTKMPEADKEVYKEQGRKDKERYQAEMYEYNKKRLVGNCHGPSNVVPTDQHASGSGSGYETTPERNEGTHIGSGSDVNRGSETPVAEPTSHPEGSSSNNN